VTTTRVSAFRITRPLLQRNPPTAIPPPTLWADRVIAIAATTAGLFLLGACLQELLWALLAAGSALAIATPAD